jgi:fatty acid desaturase
VREPSQLAVQNALRVARFRGTAAQSMAWLIGLIAAYVGNTLLLTWSPWLIVGWPLGGSILWGLWSLGHDSLHHAAAKDRTWNLLIGVAAFLPTLHPWHATRETHLLHHRHLNDAYRDTAWNPWPTSKYAQRSPAARLVYRWMRQGLWFLGTSLLLLRVTVTTRLRSAIGPQHLLNLGLIVAWLGGVVALVHHLGGSLFVAFVGPQLAFHAVFSTLTLLHHSQVDRGEIRVPWNATSAARSAVRDHTVDYDIPSPARWALFNGTLHTLHHLDAGIPFYLSARARRHVDEVCPGYVRASKFRWRNLVDTLAVQHLFDADANKIRPFDERRA